MIEIITWNDCTTLPPSLEPVLLQTANGQVHAGSWVEQYQQFVDAYPEDEIPNVTHWAKWPKGVGTSQDVPTDS